ncbi:PepSY domain-containing protein [Croceicoccus sp. Ery5]|uniref:PepSY-associated TM helix domain-containing protein n=1 Tax=Croceicoccus sp. Ery5 TaxID=1703340 RepID=UPI001E5F66AC|nr:PepSY-associated TM helix domain-containing protein [Croceicoccus sp. Ery5]
MKGGIRQSNSWLHGWAGLLLGWLMFAIFFTGTIAFFRQEVTVWMQPELHRAAPVSAEQAARLGMERLNAIAPDASKWGINLPSERNPSLRISWESERRGDGGREGTASGRSGRSERGGRTDRAGSGHRGEGAVQRSAISGADAQIRAAAEEAARRANARGGRPRDPGLTLDPKTGEVLDARETAGGDFLYRFHYQLYAMPRDWGRWIVGIATFAMFVAIISGIITHKKIFRDFFTFRGAKGQRSWLDGHNAMAVLSLPFHIMITFSGLLLLGGTLLPWASDGRGGHGRGDDRGAAAAAPATGSGQSGWQIPIDRILAEAQAAWGVPAGRLSITRSGGEAQNVELAIQRNDSLLLRPGGGPGRTMQFDARSGAMTDRSDEMAENGIVAADRVMSALHLGRFAPWDLRWLYFAAGVMGTVMVGTGLVLWSVKRAEKRRGAAGHFGNRLVDGLNIATVAGLPLATGAYFWANRLVAADAPDRVDTEIAVFFGVWAATLVHALVRPARSAWQEQLAVAGGLFVTLPLLNPMTGGMGLSAAVGQGNWLVAGFDLTALLFGGSLIYALFHLWQKQSRTSAVGPLRARPVASVPAE